MNLVPRLQALQSRRLRTESCFGNRPATHHAAVHQRVSDRYSGDLCAGYWVAVQENVGMCGQVTFCFLCRCLRQQKSQMTGASLKLMRLSDRSMATRLCRLLNSAMLGQDVTPNFIVVQQALREQREERHLVYYSTGFTNGPEPLNSSIACMTTKITLLRSWLRTSIYHAQSRTMRTSCGPTSLKVLCFAQDAFLAFGSRAHIGSDFEAATGFTS